MERSKEVPGTVLSQLGHSSKSNSRVTSWWEMAEISVTLGVLKNAGVIVSFMFSFNLLV